RARGATRRDSQPHRLRRRRQLGRARDASCEQPRRLHHRGFGKPTAREDCPEHRPERQRLRHRRAAARAGARLAGERDPRLVRAARTHARGMGTSAHGSREDRRGRPARPRHAAAIVPRRSAEGTVRDTDPGAAARELAPRHSSAWAELALGLGGFGIGTGEFAIMGLLPDVASDLGASVPAAGHLISAYALGVVLGSPLIAMLAARAPRRALLIALAASFAVCNFASALSPDYGTLVAWRFLSGVPHGAYLGVAALTAASLVPAAERTRAIGRMMLGLTGATLLGVPLATWVGQASGWRACFALVGSIGALTCL